MPIRAKSNKSESNRLLFSLDIEAFWAFMIASSPTRCGQRLLWFCFCFSRRPRLCRPTIGHLVFRRLNVRPK